MSKVLRGSESTWLLLLPVTVPGGVVGSISLRSAVLLLAESESRRALKELSRLAAGLGEGGVSKLL